MDHNGYNGPLKMVWKMIFLLNYRTMGIFGVQPLPFLPESWFSEKWVLPIPFNPAIFHFHDYGRKSSFSSMYLEDHPS